MNKKLEKQWQSFEKSVIPKDAPLVQRREMRRAFYAGAATLLSLVKDIDTEDEEQAVVELESLQRECESFISKVGTNY